MVCTTILSSLTTSQKEFDLVPHMLHTLNTSAASQKKKENQPNPPHAPENKPQTIG